MKIYAVYWRDEPKEIDAPDDFFEHDKSNAYVSCFASKKEADRFLQLFLRIEKILLEIFTN